MRPLALSIDESPPTRFIPARKLVNNKDSDMLLSHSKSVTEQYHVLHRCDPNWLSEQ